MANRKLQIANGKLQINNLKDFVMWNNFICQLIFSFNLPFATCHLPF